MITYILKVILCSGMLFLFYKVFLENEKMHRFNRFYLLISIAFSFIVPFIIFKPSTPKPTIVENINLPILEVQKFVDNIVQIGRAHV